MYKKQEPGVTVSDTGIPKKKPMRPSDHVERMPKVVLKRKPKKVSGSDKLDDGLILI